MGRVAINQEQLGSVFIRDPWATFIAIGTLNHCGKECPIMTYKEFKEQYPYRIDSDNHRAKYKPQEKVYISPRMEMFGY